MKTHSLAVNLYSTYHVLPVPGRGKTRLPLAQKRALKSVLTTVLVWVVYRRIECWANGLFLSWVPFSGTITGILQLYLLLTRAAGSQQIFNWLLEPTLRPWEEWIDTSLDFVNSVATCLHGMGSWIWLLIVEKFRSERKPFPIPTEILPEKTHVVYDNRIRRRKRALGDIANSVIEASPHRKIENLTHSIPTPHKEQLENGLVSAIVYPTLRSEEQPRTKTPYRPLKSLLFQNESSLAAENSEPSPSHYVTHSPTSANTNSASKEASKSVGKKRPHLPDPVSTLYEELHAIKASPRKKRKVDLQEKYSILASTKVALNNKKLDNTEKSKPGNLLVKDSVVGSEITDHNISSLSNISEGAVKPRSRNQSSMIPTRATKKSNIPKVLGEISIDTAEVIRSSKNSQSSATAARPLRRSTRGQI